MAWASSSTTRHHDTWCSGPTTADLRRFFLAAGSSVASACSAAAGSQRGGLTPGDDPMQAQASLCTHAMLDLARAQHGGASLCQRVCPRCRGGPSWGAFLSCPSLLTRHQGTGAEPPRIHKGCLDHEHMLQACSLLLWGPDPCLFGCLDGTHLAPGRWAAAPPRPASPAAGAHPSPAWCRSSARRRSEPAARPPSPDPCRGRWSRSALQVTAGHSGPCGRQKAPLQPLWSKRVACCGRYARLQCCRPQQEVTSHAAGRELLCSLHA